MKLGIRQHFFLIEVRARYQMELKEGISILYILPNLIRIRPTFLNY